MPTKLKTLSCTALVGGLMMLVTGCYEDVSPKGAPSAQAQAPAPPTKAGPISGQANQGGGSALGGAKRGAQNVINKAEEQSKKVAEDADSNN